MRKSLLLFTLIFLTAAFQTPAPEIIAFTATPDRVSPVDGEFTIAWEAANAGAVKLYWGSHDGPSVTHLDLPLTGSMTLSAHDMSFDNGHVTAYLSLTDPGSDLALPNAATGGYYTTSLDIALETPIEVVNFSANPLPVQPGGTLTIDWDVRNAESVRVSVYDHNMIPVSVFPDPNTVVPVQGSTTLDIPNTYIGRKVGYQLYAIDENGVWITRVLELDVQCIIPDHIAPQCPSQQIERTLNWQPFDGGMMLAYVVEGSSTPVIQVLLNNGRFYFGSPEGEPLAGTLTPPSDHFLPDGLIEEDWQAYPTMRDALGYATAPLQTYTTIFETLPESDYNVIHTPYNSYVRWVDGRVMEINYVTGSWRFLEA